MTQNKQRLDLTEFDPHQNFSIPNIISLCRLLLIPLIIVVYIRGRLWLAVILLGISALSDAADGYIARHFHQITPLGKVLDPIADKLTQVALGICLVFTFPALLPLVIVLVLKELLMLYWGVNLLRAGKKPFSARWWGKVSTTAFYIGALIIMIFSNRLSGWGVAIISGVITLLMIYSMFRYGIVFNQKIKGRSAA